MLRNFLPSKSRSTQLALTLFAASVFSLGSVTVSSPVQASSLQHYIASPKLAQHEVDHFDPKIFEGVHAFYAARNYEPIWITKEEGVSAKAQAAISELAKSWQHGLRPDKYLNKDFSTTNYTSRRSVLASREFLLSYGLALYAYDMTAMRVDPKSIRQKAEYWRAPMQPMESLALLAAVSGASNVNKAMTVIAPQNGLYHRLKDEYVHLITSDAFSQGQIEVALNGLIRPGQSHKTIAVFRERMGLPKIAGMANYEYDDALASEIQEFQKDNGLKTDGVLGPQTVKYLNRTARDRTDQLAANMERMRWLEPNKPRRYIEVNIPSMSLWAFENGKAALNMPVVVGRVERQTRSFKAEVTGVRINPRWTVPHRIRTQDFWPDLKEDPLALAAKNIDVIEGFGRDAVYRDPTELDWNNMSWREFNKYRLVQRPGDDNALGRIRVLMPNEHTIFMHDTNHPEVFDKDYRAASSGCVRLKYPEKLAEFILKGDDVEWGTERMDEIYTSLKPKDLKIEETMPVYILYQTNWLNGRGDIVFGPDLYKRDRKLIAELKANGNYYDPDMRKVVNADMKLAAR